MAAAITSIVHTGLRLGAVLAFATLAAAGCSSDASSVQTAGAPTWTGEVEQLFAEKCMACHHDGGVAPFSLASYESARSQSAAVQAAVEARRMPPWMPVGPHGEFAGDRRLTEDEIRLIGAWVAAGTPRGERSVTDSAAVNAPWQNEWQLGTPDLVVELAEPFIQPAGSPDLFRNFVLPVPLDEMRNVRAFELSSGGGAPIHHAILQVDPDRTLRTRDGGDGQPGFPGMEMGASEPPDGHFLGWTPGKAPHVLADGYAWRLPPNSDLVLQVHLPPSAMTHEVRPRVGLYFTDVPPRRPLALILLSSTNIDIPPNDTTFRVGDTLTVPVPVEALSIYPHAHFLGKRMRVSALLPDGAVRELLRIDDWNFFWQDQYRFAEPVPLPAGTRLAMEYSFDNSARNPRNPHRPPQRVRFGSGSEDEMATLSLQVDVDPANRARLEEALARHALQRNPTDTEGAYSLGTVMLNAGRFAEAIEIYRELVARDPRHVRGLANLGVALAMSGRPGEAAEVLRRVTEQVPNSSRAWYNLGRALLTAREVPGAVAALERAVELDPATTELRNVLAAAYVAAGAPQRAVAQFEEVLRRDPSDRYARTQLARLRP